METLNIAERVNEIDQSGSKEVVLVGETFSSVDQFINAVFTEGELSQTEGVPHDEIILSLILAHCHIDRYGEFTKGQYQSIGEDFRQTKSISALYGTNFIIFPMELLASMSRERGSREKLKLEIARDNASHGSAKLSDVFHHPSRELHTLGAYENLEAFIQTYNLPTVIESDIEVAKHIILEAHRRNSSSPQAYQGFPSKDSTLRFVKIGPEAMNGFIEDLVEEHNCSDIEDFIDLYYFEGFSRSTEYAKNLLYSEKYIIPGAIRALKQSGAKNIETESSTNEAGGYTKIKYEKDNVVYIYELPADSFFYDMKEKLGEEPIIIGPGDYIPGSAQKYASQITRYTLLDLENLTPATDDEIKFFESLGSVNINSEYTREDYFLSISLGNDRIILISQMNSSRGLLSTFLHHVNHQAYRFVNV